MEKENNFFDKFKDKDRTSVEKPSPSAWNRLSAKLDAAEVNPPKVISLWSKYRWVGIAAGFIILVGAIGIIQRGMNELGANTERALLGKTTDGTLELEDLEYSEPKGFYALAIKTNQYYNVSPSRLATADQESFSSRLQLKNRQTRSAKQPEYLAKNSNQVDDNNAEVAKGKLLADSITIININDQSVTAATYENNEPIVLAKASSKAAGAYKKKKEIVEKDEASEMNMDVTDANIASYDYTQLDAKSNAVTLDSEQMPRIDLNHFNWLVGNWSANYEVDKINKQSWEKRDELTLIGNAVLTINGESTDIERMEIKKVDDTYYYIRVNVKDGTRINYRLKNVSQNAYTFENEELKDQVIFKQQSDNNFQNFLAPNRSMQMSQFPGTQNNNIEFSRN